jgi:hypothetical protein
MKGKHMDKAREKAFEKLHQHIQKALQKQQVAQIARQRAEQKIATKRVQARKVYTAWVEKNQSKAIRAARIIWKWHSQFTASPAFKEFQSALGKSHRTVYLSKIHSCSLPNPRSEYRNEERQLLAVAMSGRLYVHNCVKYGKSYDILEEKQLLMLVAWPILVEIAKTITNKTIGDIIAIS